MRYTSRDRGISIFDNYFAALQSLKLDSEKELVDVATLDEHLYTISSRFPRLGHLVVNCCSRGDRLSEDKHEINQLLIFGKLLKDMVNNDHSAKENGLTNWCDELNEILLDFRVVYLGFYNEMEECDQSDGSHNDDITLPKQRRLSQFGDDVKEEDDKANESLNLRLKRGIG